MTGILNYSFCIPTCVQGKERKLVFFNALQTTVLKYKMIDFIPNRNNKPVDLKQLCALKKIRVYGRYEN